MLKWVFFEKFLSNTPKIGTNCVDLCIIWVDMFCSTIWQFTLNKKYGVYVELSTKQSWINPHVFFSIVIITHTNCTHILHFYTAQIFLRAFHWRSHIPQLSRCSIGAHKDWKCRVTGWCSHGTCCMQRQQHWSTCHSHTVVSNRNGTVVGFFAWSTG